MRLSVFETYCLYLALKNHFTRDSYDFIKYNGKTTASQDSFMTRKDRFQFQKLSRKYTETEMRDFIIANILCGKTWVGDLLEEDAEENYRKHQKIQQSLSYHFNNQLDALFTQTNPNVCFRTYKDRYPTLFMMYLGGRTSIQTMVILNGMLGYTNKWNQVYSDDSIWSKHSILIRKYAPFLEYDKTKLKNIFKEKIKEYEEEMKNVS